MILAKNMILHMVNFVHFVVLPEKWVYRTDIPPPTKKNKN